MASPATSSGRGSRWTCAGAGRPARRRAWPGRGRRGPRRRGGRRGRAWPGAHRGPWFPSGGIPGHGHPRGVVGLRELPPPGAERTAATALMSHQVQLVPGGSRRPNCCPGPGRANPRILPGLCQLLEMCTYSRRLIDSRPRSAGRVSAVNSRPARSPGGAPPHLGSKGSLMSSGDPDVATGPRRADRPAGVRAPSRVGPAGDPRRGGDFADAPLTPPAGQPGHGEIAILRRQPVQDGGGPGGGRLRRCVRAHLLRLRRPSLSGLLRGPQFGFSGSFFCPRSLQAGLAAYEQHLGLTSSA